MQELAAIVAQVDNSRHVKSVSSVIITRRSLPLSGHAVIQAALVAHEASKYWGSAGTYKVPDLTERNLLSSFRKRGEQGCA